MRIESALPTASGGPALLVPEQRSERRRFDSVELVLLGLFAAMSMWVVAIDVWSAIAQNVVWTGTDGFYIVDQMQYLAWIVSASHHVLAANMFVLRPTPSDYFQPAVVISGVITALGVAPWLSLLLWKPVAVLGTFLAIRAYAYRTVETRGQRRAVIALGLFFGCFSVVNGTFGIVGDMMPGWLSWGYPFGLMAVALIVFAMLSYERARGRSQVAWAPGLMGALASTLHPWQGELLIVILVLAELIRWREHLRGRNLVLPVLTIALTGLPLVYYVALGHLDLSWSLARIASKHAFSFWSIAIGISPLAIVAILGYRGKPRDFLELMTRIWPLAAVVIYILSATGLSATPLHAFNGITFPFAVLAVTGVTRLSWRRLPRARLVAVVVLAAATIPVNAYAIATAHTYTRPAGGNANFITRDERDALAYLKHDPLSGGVLTRFYLGEAVPGRTGRRTLVGDCLWSEPNCMPRSVAADALFDGSMTRAQARDFVIDSGARFLLADCRGYVNMRRLLGPLIVNEHKFGCAAVFELAQSEEPRGALADLALDAAVRAPRRQ